MSLVSGKNHKTDFRVVKLKIWFLKRLVLRLGSVWKNFSKFVNISCPTPVSVSGSGCYNASPPFLFHALIGPYASTYHIFTMSHIDPYLIISHAIGKIGEWNFHILMYTHNKHRIWKLIIFMTRFCGPETTSWLGSILGCHIHDE